VEGLEDNAVLGLDGRCGLLPLFGILAAAEQLTEFFLLLLPVAPLQLGATFPPTEGSCLCILKWMFAEISQNSAKVQLNAGRKRNDTPKPPLW